MNNDSLVEPRNLKYIPILYYVFYILRKWNGDITLIGETVEAVDNCFKQNSVNRICAFKVMNATWKFLQYESFCNYPSLSQLCKFEQNNLWEST